MHEQHLSISLKNFVGGERFNEVIVQVAAVRALLDVAVLGEILHPDSNIHHRLPTVFTVETSLRIHRRMQAGQKKTVDPRPYNITKWSSEWLLLVNGLD